MVSLRSNHWLLGLLVELLRSLGALEFVVSVILAFDDCLQLFHLHALPLPLFLARFRLFVKERSLWRAVRASQAVPQG